MATRPAGKAGTWYERDAADLSTELDGYLADVPAQIAGHDLPIPGARIIIAPHAGYSYSGPCAAWAYKSLDLSQAKRVFVLGPSHTYYLSGCAVTTFAKYATPFGDLVVDRDTVQRVKEAGDMEDMPASKEKAEHSLEMHMPYLYKRLEQTFGSPDSFPPIVPLLIGDNDRGAEKDVGRALVPYLKDPENAFIISSDFCHWGDNFRYMPYSDTGDASSLVQLRRSDKTPQGLPIHETIRIIDEAAMDAVKGGSHDDFVDNLAMTGNTVCGRHPIGVAMAALELMGDQQPRFEVIRYERSNLVQNPQDMSVSYVSAFAVLK